MLFCLLHFSFFRELLESIGTLEYRAGSYTPKVVLKKGYVGGITQLLNNSQLILKKHLLLVRYCVEDASN